MAQFTTTNLVNERVLVRGTDVLGTDGQTVLDASQWNEVNAHTEYDQAAEAFDQAVEAFFAPLQKAADKLHQKLDKPTDSLGYVVLHEAVEGQKAQPATVIKLTPDSVVLRLLEQGDHDRLVWVEDKLEVLEADAPTTVEDAAAIVAEVTGAETLNVEG